MSTPVRSSPSRSESSLRIRGHPRSPSVAIHASSSPSLALRDLGVATAEATERSAPSDPQTRPEVGVLPHRTLVQGRLAGAGFEAGILSDGDPLGAGIVVAGWSRLR